MTIFLKCILTLVALTMLGEAALPKNPSVDEYLPLLRRSAFVIKKPVIPTQQPIINSSLTLRGVSMFDDGWFVTVVDRKDTKKRIFLREGAPANLNGIRLVKVNKDNDDYMKTTVVVMTGGRQMTIGYNSTDIKNGIAKATKAVNRPPSRTNTVTRKLPSSTSTKPPLPTSSSSSSARRPRVRRTITPPVPRTK
jgi:hypothetical protein